GHLADKAARLVEHLAAIDAAALGITDVERRSFWLLREWHSTQPPSRVKPYFQRLFEATDPAVCVAACR
ncbi:hypothetical protein CEY02_20240, partial [Bacillus pumilus]